MKQGDLVVRKSYGGDVLFKIEAFERSKAILKGVDYRLLADSPITDLLPVTDARPFQSQYADMRMNESLRQLARFRNRQREQNEASFSALGHSSLTYFELPGKVLHLDGDPSYLRKSMALYGEFRVPAQGFYVPERLMSDTLYRMLPVVKPDILVITGHDGILKHMKNGNIGNLNSYKNSQNFVNAIRMARQYERNMDALIIIAGACQSHFEALLSAGANFASSPARVLIHALDPACIAMRAAFTSVRETVDVMDVIKNTISGIQGIGGIETKGSYRIGIPKWKQTVAN